MICEKCRNIIDESVGRCPVCGFEVQNAGDGTEEGNMEDTAGVRELLRHEGNETVLEKYRDAGRQKSKLPLIIGTVAVLILFISFGVYAIKSDLFKTPKQIYLSAEGENIMSSIDSVTASYKEYYGKYVQPLMEKPYETKAEYSMKVNTDSMPGIDNEMAKNISDLIGSAKFSVNSKVNLPKNQSNNNLAIYLKGTKLIDANILQDSSRLSLSVPSFYDKYLVLDFGNDKLNERLGIPEGSKNRLPKKILSLNDTIGAIKFDKTKFEGLLKNYGKIIGDNIDDKQFVREKGVDYKINDISVKADKITISLDEKTADNLLLKLIDAAQKDDDLYDLTAGNILNVIKLYEDAGYNFETDVDLKDELDKESFKKALSDLKEQLQSSSGQVVLPEGIKMVVYLDGHKIIGRTIDLKTKDSADEIADINVNINGVSNYNGRNVLNFDGKISVEEPKDKSFEGIQIKAAYDETADKSKGSSNGKTDISVDLKENGNTSNVLKASLDSSLKKDDAANQNKLTIKYDITAGEPGDIVNAKGTADIDSWRKDKEKKFGDQWKVDFVITPTESTGKFSGSIDAKIENTLGIEYKEVELNKDNSVDIATADDSKLREIQNAFLSAAMKFATDNQDLLKSFGM